MLGEERKNCHILAVRVSALSNPDMGNLWQHPEVLMLLRGLQGIFSAVGRKNSQKITCYSRKQDHSLDIFLTILLFFVET